MSGAVGEVSDVEDGTQVALEAELWIHDDPGRHGSSQRGRQRRRRRGKGLGAESLLPECRIMALTSLPLPGQTGVSSTAQHYVAAGCSDGVIRSIST